MKHQTGLQKKCPRCDAIGAIEASDILSRFFIHWAAPDGRSWSDANVGPDDLMDPTYGCGYDDKDEDGR